MNFTHKNSHMKLIYIYLEKFSFVYPILFYLIMAFYCLYATYFSIFNFNRIFTSSNKYYPVQLDKTWLETFLENNNILLCSSIGYTIFMILVIESGFGMTYIIPYVNSILGRVNAIKLVYKLRLPSVIFMFTFLISCFSWVF